MVGERVRSRRGRGERRSGFAGAWAHHHFRWLLSSFAVSLTGDFLSFVALVVYLLDRTGSAGWVATSAVVRVLASVVLGPLGGVVADRYDRRRLLVALDGGRFVTMAATAAVVGGGGPPWAVVLLAAVTSVFTVPYRPAAVAATPMVVGEDDLAGANAAMSVVAQVAVLAGPALGAGVVALTSPAVALVANAAMFLCSAVLMVGAGSLGGGASVTDEARSSLVRDALEGVRVVRGSAGLRALLVLGGALLLQSGVEQVVHVVVAERQLGLGAKGVGLLDGAMGLGGLLVAPFTVRVARVRASGRMLAIAGVLQGLPMVGLAFVGSATAAMVLMAAEGVCIVVFEVLAITLMQRACPEQALARVCGLNDSVAAATQLLGSVLAPLLLAGPGLRPALWATGALVVVASLVAAPALHREAAAADEERRRLAPMVELLGAMGIFGDASQAALERLARASTARSFAPGEVVFRQGDAPDDLYVVRSGLVSVHREGRGEVAQIGGGEWFGEIGLLRRVPRTATVQADTPVETWVVPGEVFLAALAGGPDALPDPLRRTMTARLVRNRSGVSPDLTGAGAAA